MKIFFFFPHFTFSQNILELKESAIPHPAPQLHLQFSILKNWSVLLKQSSVAV